jgi:hypothetical protein
MDKKLTVEEIVQLTEQYKNSYKNKLRSTKVLENGVVTYKIFIGNIDITELFKDIHFVMQLMVKLDESARDNYNPGYFLQQCFGDMGWVAVWRRFCFKIERAKAVYIGDAKENISPLQYKMTADGVLMELTAVADTDSYGLAVIPKGCKKIANDILMKGFTILGFYQYLFCADDEISLGDFVTFKPIAGKLYDCLPIMVDLTGKTRGEVAQIITSLTDLWQRIAFGSVFTFDKKDCLHQVIAVLESCDIFGSTGFYIEGKKAFIDNTDVTEIFKNREFLKTLLGMLIITHKQEIYERIDFLLKRHNWQCSDGYFFDTDGSIIKTKNVDAEIAKRALLGLGKCIISEGVLTSIEPARNGNIYIPQGITKIAVDFLPDDGSSDGCFDERKIIFNSDEEILIGDEIVFKPKRGKKYDYLLLNVDLRGKSYEETLKQMRQIDRLGVTVQLNAKYIFDKGIVMEQIKAVLIAYELLIGMGFRCCADEKPIAFIGKTNVTRLFVDRIFTEALLDSLRKADIDAYKTIAEQLDGAGWRFSDGMEFEYTRVKSYR